MGNYEKADCRTRRSETGVLDEAFGDPHGCPVQDTLYRMWPHKARGSGGHRRKMKCGAGHSLQSVLLLTRSPSARPLPTPDPHLRLGPRPGWASSSILSLPLSTELRPSIDFPASPTHHTTVQSQHLTSSATAPSGPQAGASACEKIVPFRACCGESCPLIRC